MKKEEKGIFNKYGKILLKKNITCEEDLSWYLPRKYYNFQNCELLNTTCHERYVIVKGKLRSIRDKYNGRNRYTVAVLEVNQCTLCVTWFQRNTINEEYSHIKHTDMSIYVGGKINYHADKNMYFISSPIIFSTDEKVLGIVTEYSKMQGIPYEWITQKAKELAKNNMIMDLLPKGIRETNHLLEINEARNEMQFPTSIEKLERAKERLIFDQLLYFSTVLKMNQQKYGEQSDCVIRNTEIIDKMKVILPYTLTDDQSNCIDTIAESLKSNKRVNALVQGDVSCGKTIIAFCMMMLMAANGYQSVLMAPAIILAEQHYTKLKEFAEVFGYRTVLLTSKFTGRSTVLKDIKDGNVQFIIGTTSVIAKDIEYANLGLCIIDEEQKFGVEQREKLHQKSNHGVHVISMTATPIPRTLATYIYGDMIDIYNIRQMPAGRRPQQTALNNNSNAILKFVEKQLVTGHQCYVVCAKVESGEEDDSIDTVEGIVKFYQSKLEKKYCVEGVTGRNKAAEQEMILDRFRKNEIQVLVATTVLEVGVDVKNASVIVIHNAERFGLSTLHQLRGRVGRGYEDSYCILKSNRKTDRLTTMCETTDGFKIAEADLNIRKQGNPIGLEQSGDDKLVKLLMAYPDIYQKAKEAAKTLLCEDCCQEYLAEIGNSYRGEPEKNKIL